MSRTSYAYPIAKLAINPHILMDSCNKYFSAQNIIQRILDIFIMKESNVRSKEVMGIAPNNEDFYQ